MKNTTTTTRLYSAIKSSIRPAIKSALWLLKLMIPITLCVVVLDYIGVVTVIADFMAPLFNLLGLDGRAALVFITSCITSIYSAIGVIATFGLDYRSVTILATMCLISHNLFVETAIQKKTGSSAFLIVLLRMGMAFMAGFLLNQILPTDFSGKLLLNITTTKPNSWAELLMGWLSTTGFLVVQVVVIVMLLNIMQNILREFDLINKMAKFLNPLMKILGLPKSVTFLWVVANFMGLAYGGAIMVEEVKKGELKHNDVQLLNTSIAQTHSLLEDTFLLASLGISVLLLILPRLICSIITVWAERGLRVLIRLKNRPAL